MGSTTKLLAVALLILLAGCKWAHRPGGGGLVGASCSGPVDLSKTFLQIQGPSTMNVGDCVGPFTLNTVNYDSTQQCSDPAVQNTDVPVSLSASRYSGSFYQDYSCNNSIASTKIESGTATVSVYFRYYQVDFQGASSTITLEADASGSGISSTTTSPITVLPPVQP